MFGEEGGQRLEHALSDEVAIGKAFLELLYELVMGLNGILEDSLVVLESESEPGVTDVLQLADLWRGLECE